mmetsp:Transcript_31365/g.51896  ORF Transcript_31365/g.51896 Transcript_31365/m.51896 type:complete len:568 (+) Transcript_31365:257-1960(+)
MERVVELPREESLELIVLDDDLRSREQQLEAKPEADPDVENLVELSREESFELRILEEQIFDEFDEVAAQADEEDNAAPAAAKAHELAEIDLAPSNGAGPAPAIDVTATSEHFMSEALKRLQKGGSHQYHSADGIIDSVESGAIAALRGSFLTKCARRGGRVERRQDMPAAAFWSAAELRRAIIAAGSKWGKLCVALSYRWLSVDHPDPDSFHLQKISFVMTLYLKHLQSIFAGQKPPTKRPRIDCCVFWDFPSLFQSPRSDVEEKLFRAGLQASNLWYGNSLTVVWIHSSLPHGFQFATGLAQTYHASGWCYVEAAMSATIKQGRTRIDLGLVGSSPGQPMPRSYEEDIDQWGKCVCELGCRSRPPPLLPVDVSRALEMEKVFTNQTDSVMVSQMYASFFDTVASSVETLNFGQLAWGPQEIEQLAKALPRFTNLEVLDLEWNYVCGLVLQVHGALVERVEVRGGASVKGFVALCNHLTSNNTITSLNLGWTILNEEAVRSLEAMLKVNTTLRLINLANASLGPSLSENDNMNNRVGAIQLRDLALTFDCSHFPSSRTIQIGYQSH